MSYVAVPTDPNGIVGIVGAAVRICTRCSGVRRVVSMCTIFGQCDKSSSDTSA